VETSKWITREGMVELMNIDPVPLREVVTLQAVGSKPTLMRVLMAVGTVGRNSQKGFAQVADFNGQAFFPGYMHRCVAAATA